MIVRNEESFLADCLKSLKGVADEIVVVDTGSTDGTKDIAAGNDPDLIIAALRIFAEIEERKVAQGKMPRRYIPMMKTWLDGGRWTEHLDAVARNALDPMERFKQEALEKSMRAVE